MKPTVGRIVHYYENDGNEKGQPSSQPTSVRLGDPAQLGRGESCWCWPPREG